MSISIDSIMPDDPDNKELQELLRAQREVTERIHEITNGENLELLYILTISRDRARGKIEEGHKLQMMFMKSYNPVRDRQSTLNMVTGELTAALELNTDPPQPKHF